MCSWKSLHCGDCSNWSQTSLTSIKEKWYLDGHPNRERWTEKKNHDCKFEEPKQSWRETLSKLLWFIWYPIERHQEVNQMQLQLYLWWRNPSIHPHITFQCSKSYCDVKCQYYIKQQIEFKLFHGSDGLLLLRLQLQCVLNSSLWKQQLIASQRSFQGEHVRRHTSFVNLFGESHMTSWCCSSSNVQQFSSLILN